MLWVLGDKREVGQSFQFVFRFEPKLVTSCSSAIRVVKLEIAWRLIVALIQQPHCHTVVPTNRRARWQPEHRRDNRKPCKPEG